MCITALYYSISYVVNAQRIKVECRENPAVTRSIHVYAYNKYVEINIYDSVVPTRDLCCQFERQKF